MIKKKKAVNEFYWLTELSIAGGGGHKAPPLCESGGKLVIFLDSEYLDLESESQILLPCSQATEPDQTLPIPILKQDSLKGQQPCTLLWWQAHCFPTPIYLWFEEKS